nr:uncharacterized protein LOC123773164 [Procambarus clarkii]
MEYSGNVDYPAVEWTLFDVLDVNLKAVCRVELLTKHRAVVKFSNGEDYRVFLRCYEGRTLQLPGAAGSVVISNRSGAYTYVSVHGTPIEFLEELLKRYFGQFGKVVTVWRNALTSGRLRGVLNGIRTLEMKLRSGIPSSVRLMGYTFRAYYARQSQTCFHCGMSGHPAAGCSAGVVTLANLFREGDFPLQVDAEVLVGVDVSWDDVPVCGAAAAGEHRTPGVVPLVICVFCGCRGYCRHECGSLNLHFCDCCDLFFHGSRHGSPASSA